MEYLALAGHDGDGDEATEMGQRGRIQLPSGRIRGVWPWGSRRRCRRHAVVLVGWGVDPASPRGGSAHPQGADLRRAVAPVAEAAASGGSWERWCPSCGLGRRRWPFSEACQWGNGFLWCLASPSGQCGPGLGVARSGYDNRQPCRAVCGTAAMPHLQATAAGGWWTWRYLWGNSGGGGRIFRPDASSKRGAAAGR